VRKVALVLAIVVAAALAFAAFCIARAAIDPVAVDVAPAVPLDGPFADAQTLDRAERIAVADEACGPEDVAFDSSGAPCTGCADGRILRRGADGAFTTQAQTGGRPFGLRFSPSGALLVADGARGLLAVQGGDVRVLATEAEGVRFGFTDDLDVDAQGVVYFSDASSRWGVGRYAEDVVEGRTNGRLLRFDPARGRADVVARDLAFANGVALAADASYVLVNETARYRVHKHHLVGPRAGTTEVLVDRLPCFPDNLSRSPRGTFWVGCFAPRNGILDGAHPHPLLKRLLSGMPKAVQPKPRRAGMVIEIDGDGRVLRALRDDDGSTFAFSTSAEERDGVLWLGSLYGPAIARLTLETR
jgi:sugar lactone lactonase YvrE